MTRLWNDPADFADEMIDGFVAAHGAWVRRVDGGVARSTRSPEPQVALVIGGGSGHYPAFGGLVGHGLAHAAAMGNLFASPSARQVEAVARAVDQGRGVLLSYGNYAGDVLNFTQAQDRLRADGIDCRTVVVTDDIFSAPPEEKHRRRGIAGDLAVFKIAGAAAAAGADLDEVERVARATDDRIRTIGVAFTGCTLPGAAEPLFTVPEGMMAIGLGIHGEPGIAEVPIPRAHDLAVLLVERLLAERPSVAVGDRVVPVLNGLGSVKSEELFVVFRSIQQLLLDAGLEVVDPHVGEYCTSFDMAGASLTLLWLDDELERLWLAPADTPAYRRGGAPAALVAIDERDAGTARSSGPRGAVESVDPATVAAVLAALDATVDVIDREADELGRLDAIAGDGDHGIGMQRGARAARIAAHDAAAGGAGAGSVLIAAADAWSDKAGGTSGVIWGLILRTLGEGIVTDGGGAPAIASGVRASAAAVTAFGGAVVGDKTMVDALVPFADVLGREVDAGASLAPAWRAAADAASEAAAGTASLLPRMGRSRSHGERAVGVPDPGAVSLAMIAQAVLAAAIEIEQGVDSAPVQS